MTLLHLAVAVNVVSAVVLIFAFLTWRRVLARRALVFFTANTLLILVLADASSPWQAAMIALGAVLYSRRCALAFRGQEGRLDEVRRLSRPSPQAGLARGRLSRNGHDFTERFPSIAQLLHELPAKSAVLDGEVVASDADGRPNFARLHVRWTRQGTIHLRAFDLLVLNGGTSAYSRW